MTHWIIVPVILPAIVAALIVLAMRGDLVLQRIFGLGSALALCALSAALVGQAAAGSVEVYLLGDWPAPFGIVLVLDRLSALMLAVTASLSLCVQLYAIGSGWDRKGRHFHALFGFQLMGLNGAFLTGDAFNLFVFFEILLIASYGLMIHGGGRDRLRAGVQYVAYNLVASTVFLFALATLYSVTGTLNMAELSVKVAQLPEGDAALIRVAGVLLLVVFAIKGALVPLHFWLPGTYANAPGPVAALFAVMTKVGAYAVIRVFTLIFPPATPATGTLFAELLMPAALLTLVAGTLGVLGGRDLPRLAAFAAIASMGTLFIAIALFTPVATTAALYYLVHSTFATALLFLVADQVAARRGLDGPAAAPGGLVAACYMAAAIAAAGMPPLSGFVGKLLILDASRAEAALVWPAILLTSLMMIIGFAAAGSAIFWKAPAAAPSPRPVPQEALPLVAMGGLFAALVLLTLFAAPVTDYLSATSTALWNPGPYVAAHALPAEP